MLQWYIYAYVVITTYNRILKAVILTFEYFFYLFSVMFIVDFIMVFLAYRQAITKGKGSEGVFQALIFVIIARVAVHFFTLLCVIDWKEVIEGPQGLALRVQSS